MAEDVLFAVQNETTEVDTKPVEESEKYLIFVSNGITFGVHSDVVKEIVNEIKITLIPVLPAHISGVVNLRGLMVPIIDFRRLLSQPPEKNDCIIILEQDGVQLGILVDDVDKMIDVNKKNILPVPYQNGPAAGNLVTGMYSIPENGGTLMILDIEFLYHEQ